MTDPLTTWLANLDAQALAELIERRPDLLHQPTPRDLTELAERLNHPSSLSAALTNLPRPALQLLEVLTALGGSATAERAGELLEPGMPPAVRSADADDRSVRRPAYRRRREDVERVLGLLAEVALAWPDGAGGIGTPAQLRLAFPAPLGLAGPLELLLQDLTVAELHRIQSRLGLDRGGNKAAAAEAVARHLGDPVAVRALVQDAPQDVAEALRAMAQPVREEDRAADSGFAPVSPVGYQRRLRAIDWATERGLLVGHGWSYSVSMPAQVALALLEDFRVPFDANPPVLVTVPADPERVRSESAVAATELANHAASVLDHLARRPVAALKSGGVGSRELTRVGKAVGCDPVEVRLTLELACALGLLAPGRGVMGVADEFSAWRALEPGDRLAGLVAAWRDLPLTPTDSHDAEDRTRPALAGDAAPGARTARWALLAELAALDPGVGTTRDSVADVVGWARPFARDSEHPQGQPLALVWQEAEVLGLLAVGALTPLGHALMTADPEAARAEAAALLPHSAGSATFGTDLTAMVIGSPSVEVSHVLDTVADRESASGGAAMWRLSPASVRRALDEGHTAEELLEALAGIAVGELPQPLCYLIADVGRRHGHLRVSEAVCVIRCEDEALLAEVAVDRRLRKLGLRLLAPTVLGCAVAAPVALEAMRAAGYFPMPEPDPAGEPGAGADRKGKQVVPTTAPDNGAPGNAAPDDTVPDNIVRIFDRRPGRARRTPSLAASVSADQLAGQLVGRTLSHARTTPTEQELRSLTRRLTDSEVRQLAFALDHDRPVHIVYEAATGGVSSRVISDLTLLGHTILAWCHLRSGQREFLVGRIHSVTPVEVT